MLCPFPVSVISQQVSFLGAGVGALHLPRGRNEGIGRAGLANSQSVGAKLGLQM